MRKYQIWKSEGIYAISDFGKRKYDFCTVKDFSLKLEKETTIETEEASKPAFVRYLSPIFNGHGVHPIYNFKGRQCEQIVNVPTRILTSQEILEYLNAFTILDQSTPPWDEIIYKLTCYSEILTEEYFDKVSKFSGTAFDLAAMVLDDRSEDDVDDHYFVSCPKIFEDNRGSIFHLPKPNRAHRRWVILDEYYDYKKNAWVFGDTINKRKGERIELIDKKKPVTQAEIERAKQDFYARGGKVKKLEVGDDWKNLKIHPLANLIPFPTNEQLAVLEESIRLNGVLEDIILYEGMILDGRSRQGRCVKLGIKPTYKDYDKKISPRAYVMAMGIHRRHLTSSQIAAVGVNELLPEYEIEAKKRMLNGGTQQIEEGKNGEACDLVADALKTNRSYIYEAKKIKETSPDIFKKILTGEITITSAKKQLFPPKKKSNRSTKFEKNYKEMLSQVHNRFSETNFIFNKESSDALFELSGIYLKWNRRNDKKMNHALDELRLKYPAIFSDKEERHLKLLRM
jgi:hypothetical protein